MILKYFISLFLSLLVIFVQIGLVHTTHICGGMAVLSEFSIGHLDLHCGSNTEQKAKQKSECENKNHSISKKPCCKNTSLAIQLDEKFQKKTDLEVHFIPFVLVFVFNQSIENEFVNPLYENNLGYIQTKDIPIWNQSFLI